MNLQIRDPRARDLARKLAERRGVSMTDAVIEALEAELRRLPDESSVAARIAAIADELAALAGPNRRDMGKAEIDAMWGE